MTAYEAALWWLLIFVLIALAVTLLALAIRTAQRPPDLAAWQARLPSRPRHYAPARIRVVERTEPKIRLNEVNAYNAVDRPGRHAAEWIERPTCVLGDLPRLLQEYRP